MRILIVNTWYYPNLMGGAEHSTKLLAENLVKSGHDVAVYCIDNRNKGMLKENIDGVIVYRGNGGIYDLYKAYETNTNIVYKIFQKTVEAYNPSIKKDYLQICDEFKPNIVHTSCIAGMSLYIWKLSKEIGIPIIHTIRDYWLLSPRSIIENMNSISFFYKVYLKIFQNYCKKQSSLVDVVTAPSEYTLNALTSRNFFYNAQYCHCVVNSINYDIKEVKEIIDEKRLRKGKGIKFLYAGWLSETKGIRHLIEAFKEVDANEIELILCGDGELRSYVEKNANLDKRIKYLGKLSSDDLRIQYKLSDVLIIPSIWDEPFGRVVIEGNSYGLPVIASNKGGIPEIVNVMKSGVVYNAGNKGELKNLIELMCNRKLYEKYYEEILNNLFNYSIEEQIKQFINLYNSSISIKTSKMK